MNSTEHLKMRFQAPSDLKVMASAFTVQVVTSGAVLTGTVVW